MAVTIYNVIVIYSLCSHTTGDISCTFLKENKDDYVAKLKGGNFHGFFFSLINDYRE
jgi:hypothetical protein